MGPKPKRERNLKPFNKTKEEKNTKESKNLSETGYETNGIKKDGKIDNISWDKLITIFVAWLATFGNRKTTNFSTASIVVNNWFLFNNK